MRKNLLSIGLAAALLGASLSASALSIGDLGLPSSPYDFQIKFNNYEVVNPNTAVGSGVSNTDGLYLGDSFGIFRVTTILDQAGLNPSPNWTFGGGTGSPILELTGIFWGFDIVTNVGNTAKATGGHIALFANSTWTQAIREQGPLALIGTGSTTIAPGVDVPTYSGITGGTPVLYGNYEGGCDPLDASITLCSPAFLPLGGSFLGSAKGYADVDPTVGLGVNFDTGSLLTDTPGVFRDLSVQSNFTPNFLSGGAGSVWPAWSFDPVFGNSKTVPEPTSLALLGIGLVGFGFRAARRCRVA